MQNLNVGDLVYVFEFKHSTRIIVSEEEFLNKHPKHIPIENEVYGKAKDGSIYSSFNGEDYTLIKRKFDPLNAFEMFI